MTMAGTKEIKTHIESVKDTKKITNAMYLIASTKLRKARSDLEQVRPYFDALRAEIKRIFRTVRDVESPFFYQSKRTIPHVFLTSPASAAPHSRRTNNSADEFPAKQASRQIDAPPAQKRGPAPLDPGKSSFPALSRPKLRSSLSCFLIIPQRKSRVRTLRGPYRSWPQIPSLPASRPQWFRP